MALPRRPHLRLQAPEILHPRTEIPIVVRLATPRAVKVGAVTATLFEKRWLRVDNAKVFEAATGVAPRLEHEVGHVILRERIGLRPGATDLSATLPVGNAWPSFRGEIIQVSHRLRVHAEVPWWPDAERLFPVVVRMRDAGPGTADGSSATEMQGERGRLRVAVEKTVVVPGEELGGWWRAKHHKTLGGISLQLVRIERVGGHVAERPIPLQPGPVQAKGGRKSFRVTLPADLDPTLDVGAWRVEWVLEASAEGARQWLVRVPLVVRGPAGAAPAVWHGGLLTAEARQTWRRLAQRVGLALDAGDSLAGTRGPVSVAIHAEERGRRADLVAEVSWPALGLDLWAPPGTRKGSSVAPPTSVAVSFQETTPRSFPPLNIRAREEAQAVGLLAGAPASALAELCRHGRLGLDDGGALCVGPWSGALRQIQALAGAAVGLAEVMEAALPNVPPPAAFGLHGVVKRWQNVATRLQGVLQTGSMRITGRTRAGPVEIETRLGPKGDPRDTMVRLRPEPQLPERWMAGDEEEDDRPARGRRRRHTDRPKWPAEATAALSWLEEEKHGALTLTPGELAVRLPAPLLDPGPAEMALEALVRLCRALQGGDVGPYR